MDWNQLTLNPKLLRGYYTIPPSLRGICVHRISLLRDGPSVEIVFEPQAFPDKPSPRWPAAANTCQILLRAISVDRVDLNRWGTGVFRDLEIGQTPERIELVLSGEGSLRLSCDALDVVSVTGYLSERPNNSYMDSPYKW
jgi:hypothetical protein